ncbi:MAG: glycosyltransferase 87 family protein [Chloroflexota bacterium]
MTTSTARPQPGGYLKPHQAAPTSTGARLRRMGWWVLYTLAAIGGVLGLGMLWFHLTTDPLADVRAYYDAATRLNEGQPLYAAAGDATTPTYYFYPPLLAILMRPFAAVMPYHVFAVGWAAVVAASFVALLRRLGANRNAFVALGLLGMPIGWALAIAQAHVPMTLLMAIGQPWSIALATNLKLFPVLVAVWWLGRRQYQAVGALIGWLILLAFGQWLLEPAGATAFFGAVGLDETAGVRNISPYAISPILWAVLAVAGAVGALFLAPTRWGWAAAIALATLATPRLIIYMLTGLLAAVREPDPPRGEGPYDLPPPDAAEVYVSSAR